MTTRKALDIAELKLYTMVVIGHYPAAEGNDEDILDFPDLLDVLAGPLYACEQCSK